ncbi:hypothetical protein DENSPDRAFT_826865 [Dentipellis sp. KUC8613]|nr:hypothetical protein DENSPDRAFT_826865 [Dentipellis sp. KUC8613]
MSHTRDPSSSSLPPESIHLATRSSSYSFTTPDDDPHSYSASPPPSSSSVMFDHRPSEEEQAPLLDSAPPTRPSRSRPRSKPWWKKATPVW